MCRRNCKKEHVGVWEKKQKCQPCPVYCIKYVTIFTENSWFMISYFFILQMWEILPYCMAKAGVDIFTKCLSLGRLSFHLHD